MCSPDLFTWSGCVFKEMLDWFNEGLGEGTYRQKSL